MAEVKEWLKATPEYNVNEVINELRDRCTVPWMIRRMETACNVWVTNIINSNYWQTVLWGTQNGDTQEAKNTF